MENKNLNNQETTHLGIGAVSSSADFWGDAQEFLKSQLPSDFQDKLKQYATDKGYNKNEFMLFKNMLEESVGFHGTIVLLKHYCQ
jgi:hypothetical protein